MTCSDVLLMSTGDWKSTALVEKALPKVRCWLARTPSAVAARSITWSLLRYRPAARPRRQTRRRNWDRPLELAVGRAADDVGGAAGGNHAAVGQGHVVVGQRGHAGHVQAAAVDGHRAGDVDAAGHGHHAAGELYAVL